MSMKSSYILIKSDKSTLSPEQNRLKEIQGTAL